MKAKKGITLVELMISAGIFVIIASLTFSVTNSGRTSWGISGAQIFLKSQARQAIANISEELMQSTAGRVFLSGNQNIRFNRPVIETNEEIKKVNDNVVWGDGQTENNSINYLLSGTDLVRQILDSALNPVAGTQKIIAKNVSGFVINVLATDKFEFTITFQLNNYLGTTLPQAITYTIVTTITLQG